MLSYIAVPLSKRAGTDKALQDNIYTRRPWPPHAVTEALKLAPDCLFGPMQPSAVLRSLSFPLCVTWTCRGRGRCVEPFEPMGQYGRLHKPIMRISLAMTCIPGPSTWPIARAAVLAYLGDRTPSFPWMMISWLYRKISLLAPA